MSGSRSTTQVNAGTGDLIIDEDVGQSDGAKMPVSKLVVGPSGVDGGDVHTGNPLPTRDDLLAIVIAQNEQIAELLLALLGAVSNASSHKVAFGPGDDVAKVERANGLPITAGHVARKAVTWTSATAQNTALTLPVDGYVAAILTIRTTTTLTAGNVIVEGSDDADLFPFDPHWYPLTARITGTQVEHNNWALPANDSKMWVIGVAGMTHVRLRLSTAITGTAIVNVGFRASGVADSRVVSQGSQRGTPAHSNVAASATNVTLLASNDARTFASFYNDSTSIAYLKLAATATTSSFAIKMQPSGYYELPTPAVHSGIIDCIWDTATGNMRIVEYTG